MEKKVSEIVLLLQHAIKKERETEREKQIDRQTDKQTDTERKRQLL